MRYCALVLAIAVIVYLAASAVREDAGPRTNSQPQEFTTVLRPVPAILNEETHAPVVARENKIKGKTGTPFEFKRAQFINDTHGWAMSNYSLYRTTDGGNKWERLSQEPGKNARFMAFSFVDESHGWLATLTQDFAEHYGVGNSSVIMITDDGGRSWKLQASFQDEVQIMDIRFLNVNEGLAVGSKGLDNRPDRSELFVLGTSDGGKEWKDISGPAKAAFKNQWGVANDSGNCIQWTSSSVLLLTRGGRVLNTTNRGKTWNTIVIFKDERPSGLLSSTAYYKFALDPEQKIRVLAGGMGDEGYWGDFVVHEDDRWGSYELSLTPILDAVFLSDQEVIASGLNVRPSDSKSNPGLQNAGVVLRSFDTGKSWQSIYRSTSSETFFFLTKVKDNEFYAVSDIGTFLRFSLQQ